MNEWIRVCRADEIEEEDLLRWDHGDHRYAIYNTKKGFYATDGYCTHEKQHLEEGLVIGMTVECPLHQGRFDIATGKALSPPVCENLKTYPIILKDGSVYIQLGN